MTAGDAPPSLASLLAERAWVRALARGLVACESDVDDIEQETWLAAMRRPPRESTPARAWLAAVVRNQARLILRRGGRRDRFESAGARPEATTSTVDAVAHADALRRLVSALLDLPEPYRGTLLLRYFEGLAPTEIARRAGEPVGTVKTRLRRGLTLLRERLDVEEGGDRRRALVLLLLDGPEGNGPPPTAAAAGGTAMATHTKLLAFAACAAFVGLAVWLLAGDDETSAKPQDATSAAGPASRTPRRRDETPAENPPDAPATTTGRVTGRVVDDSGAPLVGVRVSTGRGEAFTGADGAFDLAAPPDSASAGVRAVLLGHVSTEFDVACGAASPAALTLPRVREIRGRVCDDRGSPLPKATILADGRRFAVGDNARFAIPLGDPPISKITAACGGFVCSTMPVDPFGAEADAYLSRGVPCRIRVVDEKGSPVEGADVRIWNFGFGPAPVVHATSDASGAIPEIGLELRWPERVVANGHTIRVARGGFAPYLETTEYAKDEVVREIVLRRGVTTTVRVLPADGPPASAWRVRVVPVPDGWGGAPPLPADVGANGVARVEGCAPGARCIVTAGLERGGDPSDFHGRWVVSDDFTVPPDGGEISWTPPRLVPVRAVLRDQDGRALSGGSASWSLPFGAEKRRRMMAADSLWSADARRDPKAFAAGSMPEPGAFADSDEHGVAQAWLEPGGAFELRAYHPAAQAEGRFAAVDVAGRGVETVVAMRRGRVVTGTLRLRSGAPLPGVVVSVGKTWTEPRGPTYSHFRPGTTDALGRFRIEGVAEDAREVRVGDTARFATDVTVPSLDEPLSIEVGSFTLRGRVNGLGGRGATVSIFAGERSSPEPLTTRCSPDGRFVFDGVGACKAQVYVWAADPPYEGRWSGDVRGDDEIEIDARPVWRGAATK